MKLRRICETFASSVCSSGTPSSSSNTSVDRLVHEQRPQHAAQRAEEVRDVELDRPDLDLAGLDLGEVEQVVDELGQRRRPRLRMNATWRSCSAVSSPSVRSSSMRASARIEFSGVRNSWLMFERKRDLSSSARRRWSAFSSSSA